jgi:hypothetical protein
VQDNEKFAIKADIPGVDKTDMKVGYHPPSKHLIVLIVLPLPHVMSSFLSHLTNQSYCLTKQEHERVAWKSKASDALCIHTQTDNFQVIKGLV